MIRLVKTETLRNYEERIRELVRENEKLWAANDRLAKRLVWEEEASASLRS